MLCLADNNCSKLIKYGILMILDKGPGAGYGLSYGTGAGYGGRGGRSTSTQTTGSPYGDYKLPQAFGSGGGRGGSGGGVLRIYTLEALTVEGTLRERHNASISSFNV